MNVFIFISLEIRNVIWLVSWYDLLFEWEVSTGPLTRSVDKSKRIVYHRYQFLSEITSLYSWSLCIAGSGTQSLAHARQEPPLQPHQVFHTDLFQNSSIFHVDPPRSLAFSSPVLWLSAHHLGDVSHCRQELHLDGKVHGWKCGGEIERFCMVSKPLPAGWLSRTKESMVTLECGECHTLASEQSKPWTSRISWWDACTGSSAVCVDTCQVHSLSWVMKGALGS